MLYHRDDDEAPDRLVLVFFFALLSLNNRFSWVGAQERTLSWGAPDSRLLGERNTTFVKVQPLYQDPGDGLIPTNIWAVQIGLSKRTRSWGLDLKGLREGMWGEDDQNRLWTCMKFSRNKNIKRSLGFCNCTIALLSSFLMVLWVTLHSELPP